MAILCTTSGTTARPKLAMLTGGALVRHCASYLKADPKGPEDEYVSVLPLPWIMEQIYALGWSLLARMKVDFVEEPETMMADFREIGPSFVLFAPRVWEALAAEVRARVMDASPMKRGMFDLGMRWGWRRSTAAGVPPLPTNCCSARCATGSASPTFARPPPAVPRWALTPSASSWRWACRCASSMARPNCWAPTPCTGRAR
ncbi:AMP-binding protein [Siccirubricoccus deserti]